MLLLYTRQTAVQPLKIKESGPWPKEQLHYGIQPTVGPTITWLTPSDSSIVATDITEYVTKVTNGDNIVSHFFRSFNLQTLWFSHLKRTNTLVFQFTLQQTTPKIFPNDHEFELNMNLFKLKQSKQMKFCK